MLKPSSGLQNSCLCRRKIHDLEWLIVAVAWKAIVIADFAYFLWQSLPTLSGNLCLPVHWKWPFHNMLTDAQWNHRTVEAVPLELRASQQMWQTALVHDTDVPSLLQFMVSTTSFFMGFSFSVLNGHLPVPLLVLQVPLLIWIKGVELQLCFGTGPSRNPYWWAFLFGS